MELNKFYTASASNESEPIIDQLINRGYSESKSTTKTRLIIDTVNKSFWWCSNEQYNYCEKIAKGENQTIELLTLKDIQQWPN